MAANTLAGQTWLTLTATQEDSVFWGLQAGWQLAGWLVIRILRQKIGVIYMQSHSLTTKGQRSLDRNEPKDDVCVQK